MLYMYREREREILFMVCCVYMYQSFLSVLFPSYALIRVWTLRWFKRLREILRVIRMLVYLLNIEILQSMNIVRGQGLRGRCCRISRILDDVAQISLLSGAHDWGNSEYATSCYKQLAPPTRSAYFSPRLRVKGPPPAAETPRGPRADGFRTGSESITIRNPLIRNPP